MTLSCFVQVVLNRDFGSLALSIVTNWVITDIFGIVFGKTMHLDFEGQKYKKFTFLVGKSLVSYEQQTIFNKHVMWSIPYL